MLQTSRLSHRHASAFTTTVRLFQTSQKRYGPSKIASSPLIPRQTLSSALRLRPKTANFTDVASAKETLKDNAVPWWIFGCAGLLATTMTVGAASRMTKSGTSMLYYKPRDFFKPKHEDEWQTEYKIYRRFMEKHQHQAMSFDAFKEHYNYELKHRMLGQLTGLTFLGPLIYFHSKDKLPAHVYGKIASIATLGAIQFFYGRRMVYNKLEGDKKLQEHDHRTQYDHLDPYGLIVHNAFNLANFSLLLWTGFELISPPWKALELREISSSTTLKEVGQLRRHFQGAMGIFLTTVVAGTIVAGIDAGRKYHTFPKMEGRWIPEGIWDLKPARRNFFENIGLTQWDHRLLAVSTLAAYSAVYYKARMPQIWKNLPEEAKMALNLSIFAVGGQVLGGVTAVKNAVPTTLAMLHESGAVLILASSLWTLYSLRFARPILLPSVTEGLKAASKII